MNGLLKRRLLPALFLLLGFNMKLFAYFEKVIIFFVARQVLEGFGFLCCMIIILEKNVLKVQPLLLALTNYY